MMDTSGFPVLPPYQGRVPIHYMMMKGAKWEAYARELFGELTRLFGFTAAPWPEALEDAMAWARATPNQTLGRLELMFSCHEPGNRTDLSAWVMVAGTHRQVFSMEYHLGGGLMVGVAVEDCVLEAYPAAADLVGQVIATRMKHRARRD